MSRQPKSIEIPDRELCKYRDRTLALLHRYFRIALEVGRLPSILGREFFRAKVTSYRMTTFEDAVIFVHDIERCLSELDVLGQKVVASVVFMNQDHAEAAKWIGCDVRTITRRYPRALDDLTRLFVDRRLLEIFTCQPR